MDNKQIIKSLNLTEGEVLTLDKAADRMEFEALPMLDFTARDARGDCDCNGGDCSCKGSDCFVNVEPCDCKGPVGYIDCHPYRG